VSRPWLIEAELRDLRADMTRVLFTGGEAMDGSYYSARVSLPKLHLVSRIQALLESGRIRLLVGTGASTR
jgi:hypothetical protein